MKTKKIFIKVWIKNVENGCWEGKKKSVWRKDKEKVEKPPPNIYIMYMCLYIYIYIYIYIYMVSAGRGVVWFGGSWGLGNIEWGRQGEWLRSAVGTRPKWKWMK